MVKKLVLVLLMLILAVLSYANTLPDSFRVQRVLRMNALPEAVYPHIIDFHQWGAWSPWEKIDPKMQRTYSGAESGVGAKYAWEGNWKVGAGSMEITGAEPVTRVQVKLDFTKPFEGHNRTVFTLVPNGASTDVTWMMEGPSSYFSKVMSVFMSMDRMIGKDFESGLKSLRAVSEQS